jgi:hypothetical protein
VNTKIYIIASALLLFGGMLLGERWMIPVSAQAPGVSRIVSDLDRNGERIDILGRRDALRPLTIPEVESLLKHRNRYIQAIAIQELKERGDRGVEAQIQAIFERLPVKPGEVQVAPCQGGPSPGAAVLVSSAEYLAKFRRIAFLPSLLARKEVWSAAPLFWTAFRELGPGWIAGTMHYANDSARKQALSYLIAAAAGDGSLPELKKILAEDDQTLWSGALQACERLDDCWEALESGVSNRTVAQQLMARLSQFRSGRVTKAILFQAADEAARQGGPQAGDQRLEIEFALLHFLGLCRDRNIELPGQLTTDLRAIRSPVISEQLDQGAEPARRPE